MTRRIKYHYEVIGWDNARPNQEAIHINCNTKSEALKVAKYWRGKNDTIEIEVDRVAVDAEDESNYLGFELIAEYTRK